MHSTSKDTVLCPGGINLLSIGYSLYHSVALELFAPRTELNCPFSSVLKTMEICGKMLAVIGKKKTFKHKECMFSAALVSVEP